MNKYRHELKFEISDMILEEIRYRLMPIMKIDAHYNEGQYLIRSIYFDDLKDTCLLENESGIDKRSKYRIRAYNCKEDYIVLERKSKLYGMTCKESNQISLEQYYMYINNSFLRSFKNAPRLIKELEYERIQKGMRPKCIVEYERTAFVYPTGNVRITFDQNIRGTDKINTMFDEKINAYSVMPNNHNILEIKYDEFLPSFILQVLNIDTLKRQSFSKYYYVRKTIARGGQLL